jgi:hypothetical protein
MKKIVVTTALLIASATYYLAETSFCFEELRYVSDKEICAQAAADVRSKHYCEVSGKHGGVIGIHITIVDVIPSDQPAIYFNGSVLT